VTGLAVLRLEGLGPFASAPLAEVAPTPGETVVGAVTTANGAVVITATVISASPDRLVVSGLPAGLAHGLPLFSADGRAVAVVSTTSLGAATATAVSAFLERADRLVAEGLAMPSASGVSLQAIEGALITAFGAGGVLISDVVTGSPAGEAGLRPGDVLVRVGDEGVSDPADASRRLAALPPETEAAVIVRRGGSELTMALTPDRLMDARWLDYRRPPAEGPLAADLATPAQLAAAGVPPEAHVLLVGGSPPTRRTRTPVSGVLYAEVDGRPFFAILPEPAR
jgi:membrane-associated protease RseP (regulator of RpoE activity)